MGESIKVLLGTSQHRHFLGQRIQRNRIGRVSTITVLPRGKGFSLCQTCLDEKKLLRPWPFSSRFIVSNRRHSLCWMRLMLLLITPILVKLPLTSSLKGRG